MPNIDAIWQEQVSQLLDDKSWAKEHLPDVALDQLAAELAEQPPRLAASAKAEDIAGHYAAAMDACRITRRIRFHVRNPRLLGWDTKSSLAELYDRVASEIRTEFDERQAFPQSKTLRKVKENIQHRRVMLRLEDEEDTSHGCAQV